MPTKVDDDRIQERYDEGKGAYSDSVADELRQGEELSARERDEFDNLTSQDHLSRDGQDPNDSSDTSGALNDNEQAGSSSGFSYTGGRQSASPRGFRGRLNQVLKNPRKSAPLLLGGGGIVAIITGILSTLFVPFSALVGMPEQMASTNDSAGPAMERQALKALNHMTKEPDPMCKQSPKRVKCKTGRISNKALRQLERKGVTAYWGDDKFDGSRRGYPKKGNPTHYEIEGKRMTPAAAIDFLSQKENMVTARKVFGVAGAFNLRFKAVRGKFISKRVHIPLNLSRNGGVADGKNRSLPISEQIKAFKDRVKSKYPSLDRLNSIGSMTGDKVKNTLRKARRGGTGYMLSVAGCVSLKMPQFIAAGLAAYQISQYTPILMDNLLSPASKMQAGGGGVGPGVTPEDMEAVMTPLTEVAKDEDGRTGSALDSPYLLAALGINTGKMPASKYAPGYAVINSSIAKKYISPIESSTSGVCTKIMSPAALWTAITVDSATTLALSSTIIGGALKVFFSFAIAKVVEKLGEQAAKAAATYVIKELAEGTMPEELIGIPYGDVLGSAALSLFAVNNMSRFMPTLSAAQVGQYNVAMAKYEAEVGRADAAGLSPFDTSNRYTFMGSIVHDLRMASLARGHSTVRASTIFSSVLKAPAKILSSPYAYAFDAENYCGNAADFNLKGNTPENTPAITFNGTPCTGLINVMGPDESSSYMEREGWIDTTVEVEADDFDVYDLVESGYIKPDTPLMEYIETCGNPLEGDYLHNTGGCIVADYTMSDSTGRYVIEDQCFEEEDEDGEVQKNCISDIENDANIDIDLKDPRSLTAIPSFLLSFQTISAINGEDDEEFGATYTDGAAAVVGGGKAGDLTDPATQCPAGTTEVGRVKTEYRGVHTSTDHPTINLCRLPNLPGYGYDNNGNLTSDGAIVNAAVAGLFYELAEEANKAGLKPFSNSSFRLRQPSSCTPEQTRAGICAPAGLSEHQIGAAIDFSLSDGGSDGGLTCEQRKTSTDPLWKWLDKNAPRLGIKQYSKENWHWEYVVPGSNDKTKCPVG